MERRLLQIALAAAALVAALTGAAGALWGPAAAGGLLGGAADSQFRYLSGLLVGVGAAYGLLIPTVEREGARLYMLTLIVVGGGFCRAAAMLVGGSGGAGVTVALALELIAAPGLYLWQTRVARLASMDAPAAER
jgi:hypothetical protein